MAYKLPKTISWTLIRGDRKDLTVNTGVDLTGKSLLFTAKVETALDTVDSTDSNGIIKKTAVVATPTSGVGVFEFEHDDTKNVTPGEYFCDIQILEDGQPTSTNIFKIEIIVDVTQRVS